MRFRSKIRLLCAAAFVMVGQSAGAQTYDFTASNGGFTPSHLGGAANPWTYNVGTGWSVGGISTISWERLLSPVFSSTQSAFGLVLQHSYNFENGFDGGQVRVSVNGGAFNLLAPAGGYNCTISNSFSSPISSEAAFCNASGGVVSTTFSGAVANVGDTYQFAFDGAWDESVTWGSPNWLLASVEVRDLTAAPTSTVPEPSTYALMVAGLLAVGVTARRRSARATATA